MHHLTSLWQVIPALGTMLLVLFGGRLLTGAARRQVVRAASKEREGNLSPHR